MLCAHIFNSENCISPYCTTCSRLLILGASACVCVCVIIISAYLHCISTCTHSVHSFRLFMHAHITNKNVLIQLFDVYYRFKRFWKFPLLRFVLQLLHIRTHIPWYGAILHTHTRTRLWFRWSRLLQFSFGPCLFCIYSLFSLDWCF